MFLSCPWIDKFTVTFLQSQGTFGRTLVALSATGTSLSFLCTLDIYEVYRNQKEINVYLTGLYLNLDLFKVYFYYARIKHLYIIQNSDILINISRIGSNHIILIV